MPIDDNVADRIIGKARDVINSSPEDEPYARNALFDALQRVMPFLTAAGTVALMTAIIAIVAEANAAPLLPVVKVPGMLMTMSL